MQYIWFELCEKDHSKTKERNFFKYHQTSRTWGVLGGIAGVWEFTNEFGFGFPLSPVNGTVKPLW